MEVLLALLGFGLAAALLLIPFIGFFLTLGARNRLNVLEAELKALEAQVGLLSRQLERSRATEKAAKPETVAPVVPVAPAATVAAAAPTPWEPPEPKNEAEADTTQPTAPATVSEAPVEQPGVNLEKPAPTPPSAPVEPPTAPPRAPSLPRPPPPPAVPLEQQLAMWFTRIGAGALILGALYFFKYAVDNEWIGPMGRVLMGALVGVVALVVAETVRPKTHSAWVQVMDGVGLAFLYVSSYASSAWYDLVPLEIAFGANTLIVAVGALIARRHDAQVVLLLVLLAGFLNPYLLSSGQDRPFALFSYLLLLTTGCLWVAVERGFRLATTFSLFGVVVLAVGWYAKYFDVHDWRGESWAGDRDPKELLGAYHALSARTIPLTFAAIFASQWAGVGFLLRNRNQMLGWVKPLIIFALLAAHLGYSALLHDSPLALGVAMVALGIFSVAAMQAVDAMRWLMLPLLGAFLLLLVLVPKDAQADQKLLLGLLGVWASIYIGAFIRDAYARLQGLAPADAVRASIGVYAFVLLSAVMLFPADQPFLATTILVAASVIVAILAHLAKTPGLVLASTFAGALLLSAAAAVVIDTHPPDWTQIPWSPVFVALTGAWTLVQYLAVLIPVQTGQPPKAAGLWVLTLSTLFALAFFLITTRQDAATLRALLTGAVGAAALVAAAIIHGLPHPPDRALPLTLWTTVMSALALALFAPAVAFGLSGATITVIWVALTLVSAIVLAQTGQRIWLFLLLILAFASLIRVVGVDVADAQQLLREYRSSHGRSGLLQLPLFFNPAAYGLIAGGLGFWATAAILARMRRRAPDLDGFWLAPTDSGTLRVTAGALAIIAYGFLTFLAMTEVRTALLTLPSPPPVLLDAEEFSAFIATVEEAKRAQRALLAMSTTMVLALVAIALLVAGFIAKDPFHRWLGLIVFIITISKLVVWDVWNLPRLYQVGALTVVGALLVGSGFLYARIKTLFTSAAVLLFGLLLPFSLQAQEPLKRLDTAAFEQRRGLEGIEAPGDYRVLVDPVLYTASKSETLLHDLRVADPQGREVPYVLRLAQAAKVATEIEGRMFDPGLTPDGGFRADFEVPSELPHCFVTLDLQGRAPYVHRTVVETGPAPGEWAVVAQGEIVYSVEGSGRASSSNQLRYPSSRARWVRITLLPDRDAEGTRINGARFSCRAPEFVAPTVEHPLTILRTETKDQTTELYLDTTLEGLPLERLYLEVQQSEFIRRAEVFASSYQNVWPAVSSGLISRIEGAHGSRESLSLPLWGSRKRWIKVVIQNRDDAPLTITGARASYVPHELLVRASVSGAHWVYVSNPNGYAPSYEFANVLEQRTAPFEPKDARLGALVPNPDFGRAQPADDLPATEKHRTTIGWILAAILLALAAWAVMLLRNPKQ